VNSENPPRSHSHNTRVGAIVGGGPIHAFPFLFRRPDFTILLHLTTPSIGVVGGVAAFGIAAVLLMALRHKLRHRNAKGPKFTLDEPEAPPYKSGDNTAQLTVPSGHVPDQSISQKFYVSLRSAVDFVVY
jgi:hypothetical protein